MLRPRSGIHNFVDLILQRRASAGYSAAELIAPLTRCLAERYADHSICAPHEGSECIVVLLDDSQLGRRDEASARGLNGQRELEVVVELIERCLYLLQSDVDLGLRGRMCR